MTITFLSASHYDQDLYLLLEPLTSKVGKEGFILSDYKAFPKLEDNLLKPIFPNRIVNQGSNHLYTFEIPVNRFVDGLTYQAVLVAKQSIDLGTKLGVSNVITKTTLKPLVLRETERKEGFNLISVNTTGEGMVKAVIDLSLSEEKFKQLITNPNLSEYLIAYKRNGEGGIDKKNDGLKALALDSGINPSGESGSIHILTQSLSKETYILRRKEQPSKTKDNLKGMVVKQENSEKDIKKDLKKSSVVKGEQVSRNTNADSLLNSYHLTFSLSNLLPNSSYSFTLLGKERDGSTKNYLDGIVKLDTPLFPLDRVEGIRLNSKGLRMRFRNLSDLSNYPYAFITFRIRDTKFKPFQVGDGVSNKEEGWIVPGRLYSYPGFLNIKEQISPLNRILPDRQGYSSYHISLELLKKLLGKRISERSLIDWAIVVPVYKKGDSYNFKGSPKHEFNLFFPILSSDESSPITLTPEIKTEKISAGRDSIELNLDIPRKLLDKDVVLSYQRLKKTDYLKSIINTDNTTLSYLLTPDYDKPPRQLSMRITSTKISRLVTDLEEDSYYVFSISLKDAPNDIIWQSEIIKTTKLPLRIKGHLVEVDGSRLQNFFNIDPLKRISLVVNSNPKGASASEKRYNLPLSKGPLLINDLIPGERYFFSIYSEDKLLSSRSEFITEPPIKILLEGSDSNSITLGFKGLKDFSLNYLFNSLDRLLINNTADQRFVRIPLILS